MDVARQGRVLTGSDLFDDWSSTGLLRSAYCHPTQLTTPLAQGRSAENALPAWGTGCFFFGEISHAQIWQLQLRAAMSALMFPLIYLYLVYLSSLSYED